MKGRGSTRPFHRFTFQVWVGYLLYNAIIVRENLQKLTLFSFSARKYTVRPRLF